jgi:hemerythrin-like metal-binding protein
MKRYEWKPSMSVGSRVLDADHKVLVGLVDRLDMEGAAEPPALDEIFDALIAYTEYHFAREERMLAAVNYPGAKAHRAEHEGFTDHIHKLRRQFAIDATMIDRAALFDYLKGWLNHHILIQDMAYKSYVADSEAAEAAAMELEGHRTAEQTAQATR